jgi:iron complex outermembrane receptor protein
MGKSGWLKSSARSVLAIVIAGSGLTASTTLYAQTDTTAEAGDEGDAIVVTARRREERLNDVPIAVTAFSGEDLAKRGAIDITDIGQTTPNTTLEVSRGSNSTLSAFIRGVGQQDPVSGFEQGVGIYLDDVYLNRPQAATIARIELVSAFSRRGMPIDLLPNLLLLPCRY